MWLLKKEKREDRLTHRDGGRGGASEVRENVQETSEIVCVGWGGGEFRLDRGRLDEENSEGGGGGGATRGGYEKWRET